MARGWDYQSINQEEESWNEDIKMEARAGTHVLNEDDHRVSALKDVLEDYLDEGEEPEDDYWYNDTARIVLVGNRT